MRTSLSILVIGVWMGWGVLSAADWPMYRHDAARSGYTAEKLPDQLYLQWTYKVRFPPSQAWVLGAGKRGWFSTVFIFDRVYQPVTAGGLVLFGGSTDGKVYALDAETGKERWVFYTNAPVRFAPAVWKDKVFVGSDDGYLYCLELKTGDLLWKKRGGPSDEKVLGNGYVVSRWPIRGGVAVYEDTVYFGAGCWPIDRAYFYALDAATGKEKWKTVTGGAQPPPEERTTLTRGFAPQGYIAVGEKWLVVTNGHTSPGVFDRQSGKFIRLLKTTGDGAVITGGMVAVGWGFFDLFSGELVRMCDWNAFCPAFATVTPMGVFSFAGYTAMWKGSKMLSQVDPSTLGSWKGECLSGLQGFFKFRAVEKGGYALVGAGSRLYTGGDGMVYCVDPSTKKVVWRAKVDGRACGLAVSDGRLIVSTGKGYIYCFSGEKSTSPSVIGPGEGAVSAGEGEDSAAEEILQEAGFSEGYCVDLGCGDGALSLALARKSNFTIVAVEKDPALVRRARHLLDAAGVYGKRVMVLQADPASGGLPKWFANLVVSGRSVAGGTGVVAMEEARRIQRPYGGVIVVGKRGAMKKYVRGPLEGGGRWTHYLGDAANTLCSGDGVLKAPLRTFWYRALDSGGIIPHFVGSAPLFVDGVMYTMYLWGVKAWDAYNGRVIWRCPLKGMVPFYPVPVPWVMRHGYMCTDGKRLYVRLEKHIAVIDCRSGKVVNKYAPPPATEKTSSFWSFVAVDGGTLYLGVGTRYVLPALCKGKLVLMRYSPEIGMFKALDPGSGREKWTYLAEAPVPLPSVSIGGGRVYLVERPLKDVARGRRVYIPAATEARVVALDAGSGKVLWKKNVGKWSIPVTALSVEHGVLVITYRFNPKYGRAGRGRVLALRCSDGKVLWKADVEHHGSYPFIVGKTLYLQPAARDLLTGKLKVDPATGKPWGFSRKEFKSCGDLAASLNVVAFRGGSLAYIDLCDFKGMEYFGNIRPGCQINAIPVGGLLLVPEGAPCSCAYNKAHVALQGE